MITTGYIRFAAITVFVICALSACSPQPSKAFTETAEAAPLGNDADGAELYSLHCAACHGENGFGGIGIPLALPDFLENATNNYLIQTIRIGRPGRVMPSFWHLSQEEILAIVKHIRSWHPKEPSFTEVPVRGDPVNGEILFARHCAKCHGPNGEGGIGTGVSFSTPRNLPILAPALNNPGYLAAASDQMMKIALMNGREGTPMESFLKKGLSEQDINDLVTFVRSFQGRATVEFTTLDIIAAEAILATKSPYSFEKTVDNVKSAITHKNLSVIREQNFLDGFFPENEVNPRQRIIHFGNFALLTNSLARDPRLGLFLPNRIVVAEHSGVVQVMTNNPEHLSALFNNASLDSLNKNLHQIYTEILEEATR